MSDIYLQLLSRIPVVAEQTYLGEQRIQEAQTNAALSNEAIARIVHISEKTWRRWKKKGSIPRASLPAVAAALGLQLQELDKEGLSNGDVVTLRRLGAELAEVRQSQARMEEMLAEALRRPSRRGAPASG
jgi:hypothetical protein